MRRRCGRAGGGGIGHHPLRAAQAAIRAAQPSSLHPASGLQRLVAAAVACCSAGAWRGARRGGTCHPIFFRGSHCSTRACTCPVRPHACTQCCWSATCSCQQGREPRQGASVRLALSHRVYGVHQGRVPQLQGASQHRAHCACNSSSCTIGTQPGPRGCMRATLRRVGHCLTSLLTITILPQSAAHAPPLGCAGALPGPEGVRHPEAHLLQVEQVAHG